MARFKNKIAVAVTARMAGDLGAVAENDDLVDETLHQNVTITVARRNRVIVRAIANQRLRGDPGRDFVASLKRRGRKLPKGRPVGGKALADRLRMASRAFNLAAQTPFNEPRVQRFKGRRMRNRRQIIKPLSRRIADIR